MLIVSVTVNDGALSSSVFNAQISVGSTNDPPVITGQVAVGTNEEQPLTIALSHLTVTDTDNSYPQGFSLAINPGTGYTVAGTTITPVKDFHGILTVPVTVSDGVSSSNVFNMQVTVANVNDAPAITGQKPLQTFRNQAITLEMTDLQVADPDNSYPQGFTLRVGTGQHYTVFGYTVTPVNNYTGTLSVPVTVDDGQATSAVFLLKIDVVAPPNVAPVITGQVTLTTYENQPLDLRLSHLIVSDPDNLFPEEFTLTIYPGPHYKISNGSIAPEKDYSGMLSVKVTVSDKKANSDPYFVQIEVIPVSDVPLITSQTFLRMDEDDSLVLKSSDLIVLDPDDDYPTGFTINLYEGSNYVFRDLMIIPLKDFHGYLTVPVTVNDGENTSAAYQLIILVEPVNDAPVITDNGPTGNFTYKPGSDPVSPFEHIVISDPDNDSLSFAEIAIVPYESGRDSLVFETMESIRAIFDRATGTLVMFGNASIEVYNAYIRDLRYTFNGTPGPAAARNLNLKVNDGTEFSTTFTRTISFGEAGVALDIPSGFTPNGDGMNDTWSIRTADGAGAPDAVIRVYNKRGTVVFEARGLDSEWDGRVNGMLLPADSYFYTVDVESTGSRNRYKGVITILH
jgi:gliding motility-associated-like protein